MIKLRKRHTALMRRHFFTGKKLKNRDIADINWSDLQAGENPDWHDHDSQLLAFTVAALDPKEPDVHIVINMSDHQHIATLPVLEDRIWNLSVDTSLPSPDEIIPREKQTPISEDHYQINPRSVVVFENTFTGIEDEA